MARPMQNSAPSGTSNDYHLLPVTDRQMRYARAIAEQSAIEIPVEVQCDRQLLSDWISMHKPRVTSQFDKYPTGKQISFAERISRSRRRPIPSECFRDKQMMSRWIDQNR